MNDQQNPSADSLTGLDSEPSGDVFPVHVEVIGNGAEAPAADPDGSRDGTVTALRRSIAAAGERLNAIGELRREREDLLQQLDEVRLERDQLQQELEQARRELEQVADLQHQLQQLIEQT